MKETIFIDTGALFAKYVTWDSYHAKAHFLWNKILTQKIHCVTTNHIITELMHLLSSRVNNKTEIIRVAKEIYASSDFLKIFYANEKIEKEAINWLERFNDQDFSFVDTTSFAFMKNQKIKKAITFDHHFVVAGFEKFEG